MPNSFCGFSEQAGLKLRTFFPLCIVGNKSIFELKNSIISHPNLFQKYSPPQHTHTQTRIHTHTHTHAPHNVNPYTLCKTVEIFEKL